MNLIQLRSIIGGFFVACSLFACATGSTQGGSGGSGGDDGGASTSSSSSSSSSSSGNTLCTVTSMDCSSCTTCSREGANGMCNTQYKDCLDDKACVDYATCLAGCDPADAVCPAGCESTYPLGVSLHKAYISCVFCQDCFDLCDGMNTCMTP